MRCIYYPRCRVDIDDRSYLRKHLTYYCSSRPGWLRDSHQYACGEFEQSFASPETLRQHNRRIHPPNPPEFECEVCHQRFFYWARLVRHQRDKHWWPCRRCDFKTGCAEVYITYIIYYMREYHLLHCVHLKAIYQNYQIRPWKYLRYPYIFNFIYF